MNLPADHQASEQAGLWSLKRVTKAMAITAKWVCRPRCVAPGGRSFRTRESGLNSACNQAQSPLSSGILVNPHLRKASQYLGFQALKR